MRILLLEDNTELRQMIGDHLARRGFAVDRVACGEDALAAVATTPYDAMVLDLGLPDLDGMDVLVHVRARTGGQLPTLIVTARDGTENRVRGLNAGADDYIVKPFDLSELEARLRTVLRRPGARAGIRLGAGRLVFDTASREVSVDGRILELTRREAALLEELLRAAGHMVVKDALEDRLYAFNEPVSSNALEAVVSRLRKKLKVAGAGVRVETRRGIGYRLLAGEEP